MPSSQKYCCVRKCIPVPRKLNRDDVPCRACKAYGFCHCQCVSYLDHRIEYFRNNKDGGHSTPHSNHVFYVKFCCKLECFWMDSDWEEVDGIACSKCQSYCYCLCQCVTWKRRMAKQHRSSTKIKMETFHNVYETDASGDQNYPVDEVTGHEYYRATTDKATLFAKRGGKPFYAQQKNQCEFYPRLMTSTADVPIDENGFQLYIQCNGFAVYPKDTFGNEFALIDADGKPIYIQNAFGEFYYPRKKDGSDRLEQDTYIYESDGSLKYPRNFVGNPVYPMDSDGKTELYLKSRDGRPSIGKNLNNDHVYATKFIDSVDGWEVMDYYPPGDQFGYRNDGTPIYAMKDNEVIFPTDKDNNEHYLKPKNSQSDYIYFIDEYDQLDELKTYAKDSQGNQIYPNLVVDVIKKYNVILDNKYAKTADNQYIYPLDEYNNEYTLTGNEPVEVKYPLGYPITYDNLIIVPALKNKPFIFPFDQTGIPQDIEVTRANIRFLLRRLPSVDYLTDVPSTRVHRIGTGYLYDKLPLSDPAAYLEDAESV